MARYAQAANGQNSQASADYKALQAAINSGNVSDAQAALSRLQRDSKTANSPAAASSPATSNASAPPARDGDNDGGAGEVKSSIGRSLNTTA